MVSKSFVRNLSSSKINVLHNRAILYFILFLSIINITSYGLVNDFFTPTIFILVAIITSFFTKNMTVILSIALVSCNVIKQGTKMRLNEGMENNDEEDDSDPSTEPQSTEDTKTNEEQNSDLPDLTQYEDKYKELISIQEKVLGNLTALEGTLNNAEDIVKSITKRITST